MIRTISLALGTLTTLRVPFPGNVTRSDLAASTAVYPLVGAAIGVLPGTVLMLPGPASVLAALALLVWIASTGALHLDGWADCCDAALAPDRAGRTETEQQTWRQSILKDPHIGTFGVVGLISLLLTKWTLLAATTTAAAPLIAATIGRYAIVLVIGRHRPARATGLIASYGGETSRRAATGVVVGILVIAACFTQQFVPILTTAALAVLAALSLARYLSRKFGGITGDVCGAAAELAEITALLAFVRWQS